MLQGRTGERRALESLVEAARFGRAGAVVLLGEPGIGKTTLLEQLGGAESDGFQVLRTQGVEQESPLAFAALHRLLRPLAWDAGALRPPQREALDVAFGQAPGGPVDPFLIGLGTLSLLSAAAERAPVLCLVDDAHWLDPESAHALLFAVRRLHAERVAVVFATRDTALPGFTPEGLDVIHVTRLSEADSQALLQRAGPLAPEVQHRLLVEAQGNPLALRSLVGALSAEQRAGTAPLPALLAPGEALQRILVDQVSRLPHAAQRLLLVVACDDDGALSRVREAGDTLGVTDPDWDAAERSGLLTVHEAQARISHPLVRSAVHGGATSAERRSAHEALAAAADSSGDVDRSTWHRAAASTGPDEALAARLADVGARSAARGGYSTAADAYERAGSLTRDDALISRWLVAAGTSAWAAGQSARASRLAVSATTHASLGGVTTGGVTTGGDPIVIADADRLLARIEVNVGSASEGHRILATAAGAVADHDAERALELAVAAALMQGYGIDSGARVGRLTMPADVDDSPRVGCLRQVLDAVAHANVGEWADARAALALALRAAESLRTDATDLDVWGNLGNAALLVGDDAVAARCYAGMRSYSLEAGAGMSVLYALHRLGFAQLSAGLWEPIRAHAEDALTLATSLGQPAMTVAPLAWLTLLAAFAGSVDDELRARVGDLAQAVPVGILSAPVQDLILWADGVRAATGGDHAGALHRYARMNVPVLRRMSALDRIDAAVRSNDAERAATWVTELDGFGRTAGWTWACAVAEYGRALLADRDPRARDHFERALAGIVAQSDRPFDQARIRLAFGEWLRRDGQRLAARMQLRAALETFADLGAGPWIGRASEELRASGETARKRNPSTLLDLTPMERKIADLVATGLSNKEVAAQCWISPRTVAFHLRNVFAKTGITSRGELARLVLDAH